ncbi:MAG: N-acetylneuraminate synthase family protein [Phycisphaerales bacterium]|nr:N-acetylneuraminate synthase family protein [Phycisphaerales bacterium]
MRIGSRDIDPGHPPYIIAELGVNHDGSIERALDLTRAAAAAGADAVKLQLFETDRLMSKAAKLAAYQKAAGETDPVAMLKRLELSIDDMARVVTLAHELGIHAIVTVFSVELVELAERLPWDAYKTASPDIVHRPLLEALAATGRPLIVSTGASTMDEVQRVVIWLDQAEATDRLAVLQCVSCYPTPPKRAALEAIIDLRTALKPIAVGYSDHTRETETGARAIAHGALLLEKHMTHDRRAKGPDHAASLTPADLKSYIGSVWAAAPTMFGAAKVAESVWKGSKRVLDIEQDVRTLSRQSLTTRRALPRGHTITREDLTFKRPGTGLLPFRLDEVLGRKLTRDVECDVPLNEQDVFE